jgi:hypothetical protein
LDDDLDHAHHRAHEQSDPYQQSDECGRRDLIDAKAEEHNGSSGQWKANGWKNVGKPRSGDQPACDERSGSYADRNRDQQKTRLCRRMPTNDLKVHRKKRDQGHERSPMARNERIAAPDDGLAYQSEWNKRGRRSRFLQDKQHHRQGSGRKQNPNDRQCAHLELLHLLKRKETRCDKRDEQQQPDWIWSPV